jgi:ABC-type Fe3+ transport system permease subunit
VAALGLFLHSADRLHSLAPVPVLLDVGDFGSARPRAISPLDGAELLAILDHPSDSCSYHRLVDRHVVHPVDGQYAVHRRRIDPNFTVLRHSRRLCAIAPKISVAGALGTGIFITYLVPQTLLFIPLANIIRNFHLGDTPWALILTYPTFLIPFCTWLLMGYFKSIPRELEECARIDGATRWKAMLYIIIPIALPGILSAGIFAFTLSWNEFIYALVFLSSAEQKTVSVGVTSELVRGDVFYWGQLMAGALLGSIPVAFVYSFFVEHYVAGLTGSVKG